DVVLPRGPGQGRRIRIQSVVTLGIHAALVVDGSPGRVHLDRRHAGDSVGCVQDRGKSHRSRAGISREAGSVHIVDGKAATQKQGWPQRPVKLQARVVDAGDVVVAVIKIFIGQNRRDRAGKVRVTVTPRKVSRVGNLVVDLDVKL